VSPPCHKPKRYAEEYDGKRHRGGAVCGKKASKANLRVAADAIAVAGAGDNLLLLLDVLEVRLGAKQGHAAQSVGSLAGVLRATREPPPPPPPRTNKHTRKKRSHRFRHGDRAGTAQRG
jgi:hypothetical protein